MIPYCTIDFSGTGNNFVECQPKNQREIELSGVFASFLKGKDGSSSLESIHPSISIKQIELEFWGKDAVNIWNYRKGGLTGGVGIETGIPFQIWDLTAPKVLIFDGILDVGHAQIWEPDRVVASLRQNISLDMLYNIMSSISFPLLRQYACSPGTTPDGRVIGNYSPLLMGRPGYDTAVYYYKITAYKLYRGDSLPAAINTLLHMMHHINELWNGTVSMINAAVTLAGDIASTPFDIPATIIDGLAALAYLAALVILVAEIIGSVELMINQFGLIGKYKYCMIETDIIYAILTYINQQNGTLNLTFSSTIYGVGARGIADVFIDPATANTNNPIAPYANTYYNGELYSAVTWMPRKSIIYNQSWEPSIINFVNGAEHPLGDETKPDTLGPPYGSPDGNCKTWITEGPLRRFNAVLKIVPIGTSNDIQLEEMHYWSEQPPLNITLDNTDKPGYPAALPSPSRTNYDEAIFDYMLIHKLDSKDDTTDQRYNGTSCNALIQPTIINDYKYVINPGGKIVELAYAQAKPNVTLNILDQALNYLFTFINNVFKVLQDITVGTLTFPSVPTIEAYPYLMLSGDTFSVPKAFIGVATGGPPVPFNNNPDDSMRDEKLGGIIFMSSKQGFFASGKGTYTGYTGQNESCWQPTGNNTGVGVSPYSDPNGDPTHSPYENYMSADVLFRLFHSKNLITPATVFNPANKYNTGYNGGNQYDRYIDKLSAMTRADFLFILLQGNVISWVDGKTPCIIETLEWKIKEEVKILTYRIKNTYSNNFSLTISIDGITN